MSQYVPRKLADRSHLLFQFPQTNKRVLEVYVPFLENIDVMESRKSNLATYDIIGRNGNLFSFLGSKSRMLTVRFFITFLHVMETEAKEGLDSRFSRQILLASEDKEAQKREFKKFSTASSKPNMSSKPTELSKFSAKINSLNQLGQPDVIVGKGFSHAAIHRAYYQKLAGIVEDNDTTVFDRLFGLPSGRQLDNQRYEGLNKAIDKIMFWLNIIRSSTLNNSKKTSLGPPVVRLNHGIMYNNIPCVVESYNFRVVPEAGHDLQTLLPRQIEVTMTLNEVRIGNSGNFKSTVAIEGDNNYGWEAVISENNIDPYNGLIGSDYSDALSMKL
jgi:hypothetical protein